MGRDRGPVFLPYLGLNLPVGRLGRSYSAGFRLGALAGWHVAPRVSANGELTLDFMDADTDPTIAQPHEYYLDFAVSPLAHFLSGAIVVGPRLGWFYNRRWEDAGTARQSLFTTGSRSGLGADAPTVAIHSGQGLLLGINAGGFVRLGKLAAAGLLASGTFRRFVTAQCRGSACATELGNGAVMSLALAGLW